ncbi:M-phase inducer phosphatase 3-like, partial [Diaphorina citri]|uniref:protein-tyrosine-phosphatase n=1 Tax=Diaphorina citri TaxID=121845 RepID=A0A1S3DQ20_DIACI
MSTSSPRKHTISSSSPRKSTTGCDLIRSGKCDVLRRPVVMRRPEMLRSVSTTPKSTLFDYGFKKLRRSMSDSEATSINQALDRADLDLNLIGDFSKQFILPLVPDGKHHDLKNISPDTLARLIRGEFNDVIDKYLIIDCSCPCVFNADLDLNLIGDFSKQFILPLVPDGKHHDLKNISPDTLARLIRGEFNDVIDKYLIIDC